MVHKPHISNAQADIHVGKKRTAKKADIVKLAGLGAFLVVMGLIVAFLWPRLSLLFEPGGVNLLIESIKEAGVKGGVILLLLQFLQIVVAFIPGEVVQVAAGMIYGPWIGALIILVGCIISSAFIFVLVHNLGAPFVQDMVSDKHLTQFRHFEQSGGLDVIVFILFLVPGMPKDVFTYIVPLTDMRLRNFLILSNVARIPGIVLSTYAASGLVSGEMVQSIIIFGITAVIAVIAIACHRPIMAALQGHKKHKNIEKQAARADEKDGDTNKE